MKLMRYPFKRWRAWALSREVDNHSLVCFTCGNCGRELKRYFNDVVIIGGDEADFIPTRWFTDAEIENIFPDRFDATSGNLTTYYMNKLADYYKGILGDLSEDEVYYVPTGSGETLVCLSMAYPKVKFVAVYNLDEATKYEENAPLNEEVKNRAYDIIMEGKNYEFDN